MVQGRHLFAEVGGSPENMKQLAGNLAFVLNGLRWLRNGRAGAPVEAVRLAWCGAPLVAKCPMQDALQSEGSRRSRPECRPLRRTQSCDVAPRAATSPLELRRRPSSCEVAARTASSPLFRWIRSAGLHSLGSMPKGSPAPTSPGGAPLVAAADAGRRTHRGARAWPGRPPRHGRVHGVGPGSDPLPLPFPLPEVPRAWPADWSR